MEIDEAEKLLCFLKTLFIILHLNYFQIALFGEETVRFCPCYKRDYIMSVVQFITCLLHFT